MKNFLGEEWLDLSLTLSDKLSSQLSDKEISAAFGFASPATRCLVNNLCAVSTGVVFLDIGSYRGAVSLAAAFENPKAEVISIDSFTHDPRLPNPNATGGNTWKNVEKNRENLFDSYSSHPKVNTDNVTLITRYFQNVDYSKYKKPNLVFFDPSPLTKQMFDDFATHIIPACLDNFIVIFTGYDNPATAKIIDDMLETNKKIEVMYTRKRTKASIGGYRGGILVAGIRKKAPKDKKQQTV